MKKEEFIKKLEKLYKEDTKNALLFILGINNGLYEKCKEEIIDVEYSFNIVKTLHKSIITKVRKLLNIELSLEKNTDTSFYNLGSSISYFLSIGETDIILGYINNLLESELNSKLNKDTLDKLVLKMSKNTK